MNVKIVIEYDGTGYSGWQKQKNARTIQEVLENAIGSITGEKINLIGSGRTDAGVHALAQVANFKTNTKIPLDKLPYAINSKLPKDIVVKSAEKVPDDFHARFSAKAKIYKYKIYNDQFPSPLLRRYTYFFPKPLDEIKMAKAAEILVGTHDFASFMASGSPVKSTIRHIFEINVCRHESIIEITIKANGFLYNMVRIIAGTLMDIGVGERSPEEMLSILKSRDRSQAGKTLPPQGLCLVKVIY